MGSRRWWAVRIVMVFGLVPIVLVPQSPVSAAVLNVVAGDAASLRSQIGAANPGDVVSVPAGTYRLPCGSAGEGDLDITKDLTVRGPTSGTATIRPAAGCQERVFDVAGGSVVTFNRLTITGGNPSGGSGSGDGGGIRASSGSTITVRNSVVSGNSAGDGGASNAASGGGIFVDNAGALVIEGSTISGNSVGSGGDFGGGATVGYKAGGGGVAFRGFSATPGSVTITASTIADNTGGVAALGGGGGLWLDATDVTLTNVDVIDNELAADNTGRAAGLGGGVAISPIVGTQVFDISITGGSISGNTIGAPADGVGDTNVAGGAGGGLYVLGVGGSVVVDGTSFVANRAGDGKGSFGGGQGGNLHVNLNLSGTATDLIELDGVSIVDGRAGAGTDGSGGAGGGAYLSTNRTGDGGTISITDSTVSGNRAGAGNTGGFGGGVSAQSSGTTAAGTVSISGSTISNNRAGSGRQATASAEGGQAGGAYVSAGGPATAGPAVTVEGSTFSGNDAGNGNTRLSGDGGLGGQAGGLSVFADKVRIENSNFSSNDAGNGGSGGTGGRGGGLVIQAPSTGESTLIDATFTGNRSGRGGASSGGTGGGGGDGGALYIRTTGSANLANVELDGNSARGGGDGASGGGAAGNGGGLSAVLLNGAGLTLTQVDLLNNSTGNGGSGTAGSGSSGGNGGGAHVVALTGGSVGLDTVRAEGNSTGDGGAGVTGGAGGYGGGLAIRSNASPSYSIVDSSIVGNVTGSGGDASGPDAASGTGGSGAGLYLVAGDQTTDQGVIEIDSTSVVSNTAGPGGTGGPDGPDNGDLPGISRDAGSGAGIYLRTGSAAGASVDISNTTIHGNVSTIGPGGPGPGGGVFADNNTRIVNFTHATITANLASNGDALSSLADDITMNRTVVGDVTNGNTLNCNTIGGGAVRSLGYNVEERGDTCNFDQSSDLADFGVATLGPLQDNGGVGQTRVPLLTGKQVGDDIVNALVDRIPSGQCTLFVDQRGIARPEGDGCDVGAVESNPSIVAIDDVIAVGGGSSVIDFVSNDDVGGNSLDDVNVEITRQPRDGDIFPSNGNTWRYIAEQDSGASTSFDYRACLGPSETWCDTATVTIVPDAMSRFVSLSPARLFDTRQGEPGAGPKGFVAAGTTIDVEVTGVGGVPTSGVSAVAMNVTATQVSGPGFVTAYAKGSPRPPSSNLNFAVPGETIPNFVIVPVGAGGKVTLFTLAGTHLLADVAGYFSESGVSLNPNNPGAAAGRLVPLPPQRAFDTRPEQPAPGPKGFVAGGNTIDVQIAGVAGVPNSGVSAVVMNLTAAGSDGAGFVTAFPTGTPRPVASNLNMGGPGETAPNLVIVPLGKNGRISLFTRSGTHLLGDVTGYITDGTAARRLAGLFVPVDPDRSFDTREAEIPPGPKGYLADAETITTKFSGVAGVPASGAAAVMINATATGAAGPGFVTAWPSGKSRPNASTLNLTYVGQTRPNAAVLPLGAGGRIDFFSLRGVDLLADVFGWFLG